MFPSCHCVPSAIKGVSENPTNLLGREVFLKFTDVYELDDMWEWVFQVLTLLHTI